MQAHFVLGASTFASIVLGASIFASIVLGVSTFLCGISRWVKLGQISSSCNQDYVPCSQNFGSSL